MLNNKGFSFIEMLTVTIILCIIAIAAFPVILSLTDSSNEQIYDTNVKAIEKAALTYAIDNSTDLQENEEDARFISLDDLEKLEYIKNSDITDPRNDIEMNGCVMIYLNEDDQYKTKYYEDTCNNIGSEYAPRIEVLKNIDDTYEVNSGNEVILPTIKATTVTDVELDIPEPNFFCNNKEVETLDEGRVGDKCEIIFKIKDPNNKITNKEIFKVEIVDTLDPVIMVNGQSKSFTMNVLVDSDFEIMKPIIVDNSDEIKDSTIKTNINPFIPGTYEIIYSATDIYDNVGILIVTINVINDALLEENKIIVDNASVLPGDGILEKNDIGEYIFKGTNPNNYITYNNELYRIIKLDTNGIKVIKLNELIKTVYSTKESTNYSSSELKKVFDEFSKDITEKGINKEYNFNAGKIDLINILPIDELFIDESSYRITDSYISNINVSDYINASNSSACLNNISDCKNDNYLNLSNSYLTNHTASDISVVTITNGSIIDKFVGETVSIYPVIYLSGYESFRGTGTLDDPYELIF